MSQSHVDSHIQCLRSPKKMTSNPDYIRDLRERAMVDPTDSHTYPVHHWIVTIERLYTEGEWEWRNGELEKAYIAFMRGCSIMAEIVKRHPGYQAIRFDPAYVYLKQLTNDRIFYLLQEIARQLEMAHACSRGPYAQPSLPFSNNPFRQTGQVPTPHQRRTDPPPTSKASYSSAFSDTQGHPQEPIVHPLKLAKWITSKNSPFSVLILDVRPRLSFRKGCIRHEWLVQIDPSILQPGINAQTISHSLHANPEIEKSLFAQRHQFEIVVYYDQSAVTLREAHPSLHHLVKALVNDGAPLTRPPVMLAGGFQAWETTIGERGIYRFPNTQETPSGANAPHRSLENKAPSHRSSHASSISQSQQQLFDMYNSRHKQSSGPTVPASNGTGSSAKANGSLSSANTQNHLPMTPVTPVAQKAMNSQKHVGSDLLRFDKSCIGITGLKNLGNTCYMNSILQCLSGTVPLASFFISGHYAKSINRNNRLGSGGALAEVFAQLLRAMWSRQYSSLSPLSFHQIVTRFATQFADGNQHDSQEFLTCLLDGLHEDLNMVSRNAPVDDLCTKETDDNVSDWQARALAWEKYLARNTSIIVNLFQGQYRSRLTCLSCKHTSTTYNPFMSLSLPIPNKKMRLSHINIYECFDLFVKEETLKKNDAWRCPKCDKLRRATKQLTMAHLPDILLIHLKRFSSDGPYRSKVDSVIQFPLKNLDLSGYIPDGMLPPGQNSGNRPSFVYNLYAVSNHCGSLNEGHYTAYVHNSHDGHWYHFDDNFASPCDKNKVVSSAAYNLFYARSTVL